MKEWQQFFIKFSSGLRILICGPFVKQKNRSPLEEVDNKRETFSLAC
jgi:hypothetical protein